MKNQKKHHFKYSQPIESKESATESKKILPVADSEQAPEALRDLKRVVWMIGGFVLAIILLYFTLKNQDLSRFYNLFKF